MKINNFKLIKENDWIKVQADILWREKNFETAYFAIPAEFIDEIDISCADNFLIALMLLAIKNNEDIYVEGAGVSKSLVKNLYNILFPALYKMGCGTGNTKIYADFVENDDQARGSDGATGISMGVDSFYSILKYKNYDCSPVKTVLYIQQLYTNSLVFDDNIQQIFNIRKQVADKLNIKFIPVLTNMRFILDKEFVFTQYHAFCHLSAALTLKSISCYYYATGFSKKEMKLCFDDTAYYDDIISSALSHKNFMMKMSGEEVTRYQKTELISNNIVVQEYLDVCLKNEEFSNRKYLNCSLCHKCVRTLATLEVLERLSDFKNVFDIELYNKNRRNVWGEMAYRKIVMKDVFAKEILANAKKANLKLPMSRWFKFFCIGIHNQFEKIKGKFKA